MWKFTEVKKMGVIVWCASSFSILLWMNRTEKALTSHPDSQTLSSVLSIFFARLAVFCLTHTLLFKILVGNVPHSWHTGEFVWLPDYYCVLGLDHWHKIINIHAIDYQTLVKHSWSLNLNNPIVPGSIGTHTHAHTHTPIEAVNWCVWIGLTV